MSKFIALLASLLCSLHCYAVDNSKVAIGAKFNEGRRFLAEGKFQEALNTFNEISTNKEIDTWAKLFGVDALIGLGKYDTAKISLKELNNNSLTKLENLYSKKLSIEISLLGGVKYNSSNVEKSFSDFYKSRSNILESNTKFLQAVMHCRNGRYISCLKSLQDIRSKYPKSITAEKAYRFQASVLETNFLNKASILSNGFWLTELKTLNKEGKFKESDSVFLTRIAPSKPLEIKDSALFLQRVITLQGLKDKNSLAELLNNNTSKGNALRSLALSQLANDAWNKSEYAELESYLTKIGHSAYTIYLKARVLEENSKYELAMKEYEQLIKIGGHEYIYPAGMRLAWLYFREGKSKEGIKILSFIKKKDPGTNYFDSQAVNYWSSQNPKVDQDPRLFYYWLSMGKNVVTPEILTGKPAELKLISSSQCNFSKVDLSEKQKLHLKEIAEFGLYDIVREELKLIDKSQSQNMSEVRARAKFISDLGAPSESIKELRASDELFALLEKNCLGLLLDILYPQKYWDIFEKEAKRTGIDTFLLAAITRTESAFDPLAISRSGAMGLMQLMPQTAVLEGFNGFKEGKPENAFIPDENIKLGANHLMRLMEKWDGKWHLVIAAYNAGSVAVQRWIDRYPDTPPEVWIELIPYKETRNYVKKVLGSYWAYKNNIANKE
ncbi:MAG: lytic transglycosylase domain-containing protein [bacterium]|nr:lytic transglycosylase domain-containing protein [bacterium]